LQEKGVAVDASVWIAAQDPADPFCSQSRLFFSQAVVGGIILHVPAFARVEVACALARKLRNSLQGERLANLVFQTAGAKEHPVNSVLLAKALTLGTTKFLGGPTRFIPRRRRLSAVRWCLGTKSTFNGRAH
jgi:hypothetical protein